MPGARHDSVVFYSTVHSLIIIITRIRVRRSRFREPRRTGDARRWCTTVDVDVDACMHAVAVADHGKEKKDDRGQGGWRLCLGTGHVRPAPRGGAAPQLAPKRQSQHERHRQVLPGRGRSIGSVSPTTTTLARRYFSFDDGARTTPTVSYAQINVCTFSCLFVCLYVRLRATCVCKNSRPSVFRNIYTVALSSLI